MFPGCTSGGGQVIAPGPIDTCMTPGVSAGAPGPLPYPLFAMFSQAADCSTKVQIKNKDAFTKKSTINTSTGDEAGNSPGGVVSSKFKGKSPPTIGAFNVKVEGEQLVHLLCLFQMNGG